MKLRVTLVLVSCILSILTGLVLSRKSGPAQSGGKQRSRPLIGLSMDTLKEERWQGDRDMFIKRAGELGADVEVLAANSDDNRQIKDVEALITKNVDAMVIIPHDGAACAKAVDLSRQAGIPVLAYDRLITNSDLDLYMTFDNVKVGELQAKYVADAFAKTPGKKKLVRIYGSKTDNNAFLFKQGQDNIIQPLIDKGEIEIVHEDWAQDWRPENAKKIANAAITKAAAAAGTLPFDAILASNDGTAGFATGPRAPNTAAASLLTCGSGSRSFGSQSSIPRRAALRSIGGSAPAASI